MDDKPDDLEQNQDVEKTEEEDVYLLEENGDTTYESLLEEVEGAKSETEEGEEAEEVSGLAPVDPSESEAKLLAENQELKDRYIRILADHENFKRRTEKERIDTWNLATGETIRELLPVLDNFERAIQSGRVHDPDSELLSGIEMIYEQLIEVLEKQGVTVIDEIDVPFDPQIHEGVHREENEEVPAHTVIEILQKGYTLKGRLVRPAMVKVAVGGPEPEVAEEESAEENDDVESDSGAENSSEEG